jgi:hypothetical protein
LCFSTISTRHNSGVQQAINDQIGPVPEWNPAGNRDWVIRDIAARARVEMDAYEHFTITGDYIESARRTRFTVLHSPFAEHPLGLDIFNDAHDVQWGRREVDGIMGYGPLE